MTDSYSFLRYLYTKYSERDYLAEGWSPINETLKRFLENSIENFQPMSYQSIYCLVYKIVCKGYKERLFEDLKKLLTDHCQSLKNHLDENYKRMTNEHSTTHTSIYVLQFINYLHQYIQSTDKIVPLFHYLDVIYLKPKLRSTTRHECLLLYKTIIIEPHISHIFSAMEQLMNTSDSLSKETIGLLLQMINDYTPESAVKQRDLFKRYCNGEDVFNEEPMITSASRTSAKRSVENLPDDDDQPSAKRPMHIIATSPLDN